MTRGIELDILINDMSFKTDSGEVPLETALRMLADMVDARIVLMGGGVHVTTPVNAEVLDKELRQREQEPEKRDHRVVDNPHEKSLPRLSPK